MLRFPRLHFLARCWTHGSLAALSAAALLLPSITEPAMSNHPKGDRPPVAAAPPCDEPVRDEETEMLERAIFALGTDEPVKFTREVPR